MASIEVMGSLPAFALDCTLENVGRTIASTKVRIRWHFVFNGQTDDHLVALVHSSLSGKKQVRRCAGCGTAPPSGCAGCVLHGTPGVVGGTAPRPLRYHCAPCRCSWMASWCTRKPR